MIKITLSKEPITLGQFLKFSGVVSTGGEVKIFLENNVVLVNKNVEKRRGKQLFKGDLVEIQAKKYLLVGQNDHKEN